MENNRRRKALRKQLLLQNSARRRKIRARRGYAYRDNNDPLRESIALGDLKQLLVKIRELTGKVINVANTATYDMQELTLLLGEVKSLPKEHGFSKLPDKRAPNLSAIYKELGDSRITKMFGSATHGQAQDVIQRYYDLEDEVYDTIDMVNRVAGL